MYFTTYFEKSSLLTQCNHRDFEIYMLYAHFVSVHGIISQVYLLSRDRSGTSNLAHETGTSLQSRGSSGGRLVTPGYPLAAWQPQHNHAAILTLEPRCTGKQFEYHRIHQSTFGPLSTHPRSFQRLHPRLELQSRSKTAKSTTQR